jgi:hypothetical protein
MTSKKPDGGQAFPQPLAVGPNDDAYPAYPGMSLRDWFAGQALAGILAFPGVVNGSHDKSAASCVRASYFYADAMIKERDK